MLPSNELGRVLHGPPAHAEPGSFGLVVVTATVADASPHEVLDRAREVMSCLLTVGATEWPNEQTWARRLPTWFVTACPPEQSADEQQRWLDWWRTLDAPARAEAEASQGWALPEWLCWMRPPERTWYWWDGSIVEGMRVDVTIQVARPRDRPTRPPTLADQHRAS